MNIFTAEIFTYTFINISNHIFSKRKKNHDLKQIFSLYVGLNSVLFFIHYALFNN